MEDLILKILEQALSELEYLKVTIEPKDQRALYFQFEKKGIGTINVEIARKHPPGTHHLDMDSTETQIVMSSMITIKDEKKDMPNIRFKNGTSKAEIEYQIKSLIRSISKIAT